MRARPIGKPCILDDTSRPQTATKERPNAHAKRGTLSTPTHTDKQTYTLISRGDRVSRPRINIGASIDSRGVRGPALAITRVNTERRSSGTPPEDASARASSSRRAVNKYGEERVKVKKTGSNSCHFLSSRTAKSGETDRNRRRRRRPRVNRQQNGHVLCKLLPPSFINYHHDRSARLAGEGRGRGERGVRDGREV